MLWLAIFVPALPLQVFTRAQVEVDLPLAVLDASARARILLANDVACAQGVHAGQAVAAAQAIAPADVEWLFKRFTHGEASSSTRGAGLGLAIVRAIADAHDGTVFVDSVVGQGATFGLRIPAQLAPAPELVGAR